jgi:hypothetical protein
LFDVFIAIRDGTGVFAAQYGQRRGFFAGVSKKFLNELTDTIHGGSTCHGGSTWLR